MCIGFGFEVVVWVGSYLGLILVCVSFVLVCSVVYVFFILGVSFVDCYEFLFLGGVVIRLVVFLCC